MNEDFTDMQVTKMAIAVILGIIVIGILLQIDHRLGLLLLK